MMGWEAWAPPLDPPVAGGLDAETAQEIADATWAVNPHLCAALQWEAYAATLPPGPSVAQISTGGQSVSYSPPAALGDYGTAMARAAWHRSFLSSLATVPLRAPHHPHALPAPLTAWWPTYPIGLP
jgi:hypothetical protein